MNLAHDPEVLAAREDYREQLEVEAQIMALPRFDYSAAWEVSAAIQARLERIYENSLDPEVERTFKAYREALERAIP